MSLFTAKRLLRLRRLGGRVFASVGLRGFARRHLRGLRGRMKAKESELEEAQEQQRSLEPLLGDLRSLARAVRPYEAPSSSAPRVLLFTGRGMWSRDKPLVDGLLYHALRQRFRPARVRGAERHAGRR